MVFVATVRTLDQLIDLVRLVLLADRAKVPWIDRALFLQADIEVVHIVQRKIAHGCNRIQSFDVHQRIDIDILQIVNVQVVNVDRENRAGLTGSFLARRNQAALLL